MGSVDSATTYYEGISISSSGGYGISSVISWSLGSTSYESSLDGLLIGITGLLGKRLYLAYSIREVKMYSVKISVWASNSYFLSLILFASSKVKGCSGSFKAKKASASYS